jgi:Ca2+-binding RTX toxin-like protein
MAYFTFTDASTETFVVRLDDPLEVAHARDLLAGATEADARIGGTVDKAEADYNIGWSYHLAPESIFFFEVSTEVGDSTMRYIETHLEEVGGELLPGSVWTGWSSQLTGELAAQEGGAGADRLRGSGAADLLLGREGADRLAGRGGDDHLAGGDGADLLRGGRGEDKLGGGDGNDTLFAGAGDDVLDGGADNDILFGDDGADAFVFDAPEANGRDTVLDFGEDDVLHLDAGWLAGIGDLTGDGTVDAADALGAFGGINGTLVLFQGGAGIVLQNVSGRPLQPGDIVIV